MGTPDDLDGRDRRSSAIPIVLLVVGGALTLWFFPFPRPRHGEPPEFNGFKAKADIAAIVEAVWAYAAENQGQLPASLEPLVQPDENGGSFLSMETVPLDPWKHPYRYELCDEAPGFRVFTLGADGRPGGQGEDGDLDNLALEEGRL